MEKTFESAMKELEAIVKDLENKDIDLEQAISKYNKGLEMSKLCYEKLEKAELIVKTSMGEEEVDFKDENKK